MKFILAIALSVITLTCFSQVEVVHFNAGFNSANDVSWFGKLKDAERKQLLIEEDGNQSKYGIAVVPTIIIFDDGEEVKRFQADISFKIVATKEEIQDYIDELIMSKF